MAPVNSNCTNAQQWGFHLLNIVLKSVIVIVRTRMQYCDSCAQPIDLEFELKYAKDVGDMMSTLVPNVVDPLLQYAAERGTSGAVRDIAATAHDKTKGLSAMLYCTQ